MWLLYLLLGCADGQLLPGNNETTECNIPGNFMCSNGLCIPGSWQCDGVTDCFDGSDEKECRGKTRRPSSLLSAKAKSKCGPTFFPCASGIHCIIGRFQCNGLEDCPDGSDEENCTAHPLLCSITRFHCKNKLCIDKSFVCDGENNCKDNSDEENCSNTQESLLYAWKTGAIFVHFYPKPTSFSWTGRLPFGVCPSEGKRMMLAISVSL